LFSGVYTHSIDAKGRTSLPSHFREILSAQGADKLFVTAAYIALVAYNPRVVPPWIAVLIVGRSTQEAIVMNVPDLTVPADVLEAT